MSMSTMGYFRAIGTMTMESSDEVTFKVQHTYFSSISYLDAFPRS